MCCRLLCRVFWVKSSWAALYASPAIMHCESLTFSIGDPIFSLPFSSRGPLYLIVTPPGSYKQSKTEPYGRPAFKKKKKIQINVSLFSFSFFLTKKQKK